MPRKSKVDQDIGYMRLFWDEVREVEADYRAIIQVFVHPSSRPGVFTFRMVGGIVEGGADKDFGTCAVQFEYPNVHQQSLPAVLWAYAAKLHNVIHEAYTDHQNRAQRQG